jgi:hypothetical protein
VAPSEHARQAEAPMPAGECHANLIEKTFFIHGLDYDQQTDNKEMLT